MKKLFLGMIIVLVPFVGMAAPKWIDNLPTSMSDVAFDLRISDSQDLFGANCNGSSLKKNGSANLLCLPSVYGKDLATALNLVDSSFTRICDPNGDPTAGDAFCNSKEYALQKCLDLEGQDLSNKTIVITAAVGSTQASDVVCTIE